MRVNWSRTRRDLSYFLAAVAGIGYLLLIAFMVGGQVSCGTLRDASELPAIYMLPAER